MRAPTESAQEGQVIPLGRLANFVRQISHDVRNGLNAIDLQAAYIAEIAGGGELADEVGKLRKILVHVTGDMQELSARFGEVRPVWMEFPVDELVQGLKREIEEEFETQSKRVVWEVRNGDVEVAMDYNLLVMCLAELLRNAIYFREGDAAIHFLAQVEGGEATFEVRQVRSAPVGVPGQWGSEPLASSRRGGYGLGLFHVRRVLEALGGRLEPVYDGAARELSVRLILPPRLPDGNA